MATRTSAFAPLSRDVAGERTGGRGEQRRIVELDGLRALAIVLVLIYHAMGDGRTLAALRKLPGKLSLSAVVFDHAWLGVDLFFVLSGFLITGVLLSARKEPHYYKNFYIRRALRILPILFVVLAWLSTIYHGPATFFILALLFCANVASFANAPIPPGGAPLWSLAVEEQFYLIWPTVVRKVPARGLLWIAGAICLAVPFARMAAPDLEAAIRLTPLRCDGLAFGALAALWMRAARGKARRRIVVPALGAVALAALLLGLESALHTPRISHALRITEADLVFAAAVVGACAFQGSRATGFLRSGLATFVAGTSYCAYLIHVGVFNAIDAWHWTASPSGLESGVLRFLCGVPIVFALAALSKSFLEDPFLSLKSRLAPHEDALAETA